MFASPPVGVLLASSSASTFGTLYVALGGASMIALRTFGWRPVLFVLAVVWVSDSAAYYVGRRFGKRKLAPVVSPKKTFEGSGDSSAGGSSSGFSRAASLSDRERGRPRPPRRRGGRACRRRDLLESTFKRSCDVKDSGGSSRATAGFSTGSTPFFTSRPPSSRSRTSCRRSFRGEEADRPDGCHRLDR